jgi:hypothetical protein
MKFAALQRDVAALEALIRSAQLDFAALKALAADQGPFKTGAKQLTGAKRLGFKHERLFDTEHNRRLLRWAEMLEEEARDEGFEDAHVHFHAFIMKYDRPYWQEEEYWFRDGQMKKSRRMWKREWWQQALRFL